jgi:hypothetical protein
MILKYSGSQGFPQAVSEGASNELPMLIPRPSLSFIWKASSLSCAFAEIIPAQKNAIKNILILDMIS